MECSPEEVHVWQKWELFEKVVFINVTCSKIIIRFDILSFAYTGLLILLFFELKWNIFANSYCQINNRTGAFLLFLFFFLLLPYFLFFYYCFWNFWYFTFLRMKMYFTKKNKEPNLKMQLSLAIQNKVCIFMFLWYKEHFFH